MAPKASTGSSPRTAASSKRVEKRASPSKSKTTPSPVTEENMRMLWMYHLYSGAKPTHQKVADSLGIPNSTVAWRYARIRDYFKDCELPEDSEQQQRIRTKARTPKKRTSAKSKTATTSDSETEKLSGADKLSVQKKAPGYSLMFDGDEGMADANFELDDDPQYVYKDNEDDYN